MDKSEYTRDFGEFLKQKRTSKNWSQTDLASMLENNPQNISRIERGLLTPTIFWIAKLSLVFECNVSELLSEFELMRIEKLKNKCG